MKREDEFETPHAPEETRDAATEEAAESAPAPAPFARNRLFVGVAILAVFAVIIGVRLMDRPADVPFAGGQAPAGASATVDPVAALDEAIAAGGPVVVLFHSGACPSCVATQEAVAGALPEYPEVTYVEARTDDPRTSPLYTRFSFQFVPTLFFLSPGGEVLSQHSGVVAPDVLRSQLDALVGGEG
ncbi:MAG: thioredoxin family protein [Clostridiales bacterium]|nr:thioredoxin family protein [Clostridiales bacterium]